MDTSTPKDNRPSRLHLFLAAGILIIISVLLSWLATHQPYFPFDPAFSQLLQSYQNETFVRVMEGLTWCFDSWRAGVLTAIAAGIIWWRMGWQEGGLVALAGLLGVLEIPLKAIIQRPRPGADLVQVLSTEEGFGFPSGHAVFITLLLGVLVALILPRLKRRRCRILLVAGLSGLLLLIGYTRIYLGVHWLSDVIGGYVMGATLLMILLWVVVTIMDCLKARSRHLSSPEQDG